MLRRVTGLLLSLAVIAVASLTIGGTPTRASTGLGKICFDYTNSNGLKTVRECAMVDEHVYPAGSGQHHGYGEFTFTNTKPTHAAQVKLTYNALFSRTVPGAAWCDGNVFGSNPCTGGGDWPSNWVFGIDPNPADYHTADTIKTHCQVYMIIDTQIQWTAGNGWFDQPVVASLIVDMTTPCGP